MVKGMPAVAASGGNRCQRRRLAACRPRARPGEAAL